MREQLKGAWRPCLAELIGTFALVFIGAGVVCADSFLVNVQRASGGIGLLGIALAHGLVLAIIVSATGHISGGHINPAVTAGFLVTGRITRTLGILYILSQLVGAILASLLLRAIFPADAWQPATLGTPALGMAISYWDGVLLEFILTFFLVFTVFAVAVDERAPKSIYGFAIGLVLTFDILAGGPLTGAAMNPARAFGPALVSGSWNDHLVYWIGPLLGGMAAALLYNYALLENKA
jgi:MIP family channel proteins